MIMPPGGRLQLPSTTAVLISGWAWRRARLSAVSASKSSWGKFSMKPATSSTTGARMSDGTTSRGSSTAGERTIKGRKMAAPASAVAKRVPKPISVMRRTGSAMPSACRVPRVALNLLSGEAPMAPAVQL